MNESYVNIDGIPVKIENEKNLLELIRKAGVKMPTFCYHSELSIYGACRMCMVETDKGGLEAACSTPPKGGMVIRTNTERLRKYRKNILELLLANHCRDCTTCSNNGKCKLQDLATLQHEGYVSQHRHKPRSTKAHSAYKGHQQVHTLRRWRPHVQRGAECRSD